MGNNRKLILTTYLEYRFLSRFLSNLRVYNDTYTSPMKEIFMKEILSIRSRDYIVNLFHYFHRLNYTVFDTLWKYYDINEIKDLYSNKNLHVRIRYRKFR